MVINKDKTKAMVISSDTKDTSWDIGLFAEDTQIETVKHYPFLGNKLDNGLYFGAHTEKMAVKCRKRNRVIKALAWKEWGNQLETQRTLYIQWIRSCLEYASSSWSPWISNTNTLKLERIQREALRGMTGLAKTCQSDFLHLEAGVEPLPARFEKMDEILYDKYLRLPPDDARFQLTQRSIPPRLKTRHGWRHTTQNKVTKDILRDITSPPTPPWQNYPQFDVQYVEFDGRKQDISPSLLKQTAQNRIAEFEIDLIIYTDGSTSGDQ